MRTDCAALTVSSARRGEVGDEVETELRSCGARKRTELPRPRVLEVNEDEQGLARVGEDERRQVECVKVKTAPGAHGSRDV